jgi:hypothetical protein
MVQTNTFSKMIEPTLREIFYKGIKEMSTMIPFIVLCKNCFSSNKRGVICQSCSNTSIRPIPLSELIGINKDQWRKEVK